MEDLFWLIVLLAWFVGPVLVNRKLAINKGRNQYNWMMLGFFFSWSSTVVLLVLSSACDSLEHSIRESRKATKHDIRRN